MSIPDKRQEKVRGAKLQASLLNSSCHLEHFSVCGLFRVCTSGLATKNKNYTFFLLLKYDSLMTQQVWPTQILPTS